MAKVLYLSGWFMLGCSASSLVSWFGSLHPGAFKIAIAFYSLEGDRNFKSPDRKSTRLNSSHQIISYAVFCLKKKKKEENKKTKKKKNKQNKP